MFSLMYILQHQFQSLQWRDVKVPLNSNSLNEHLLHISYRDFKSWVINSIATVDVKRELRLLTPDPSQTKCSRWLHSTWSMSWPIPISRLSIVPHSPWFQTCTNMHITSGTSLLRRVECAHGSRRLRSLLWQLDSWEVQINSPQREKIKGR